MAKRLKMPKNTKSVCVIERILPNRNVDSSGVNPGVRKLQMSPMLMPKVQKMAMAESSRIFFLWLNHWMPQADKIEKRVAESVGEKPKYTPNPTPPNEACVMPPLMKTSRLLTIYVPTKPHRMLAKRLPIMAC